MSGRERGGPFPNPREYLEAQQIGPYPTWGSWKHQVAERFGQAWVDGCPKGEELVHKFYIMRRLDQKRGSIDPERVAAFWEDVEGAVKGFESIYGEIVAFIVERTPVIEKKRK